MNYSHCTILGRIGRAPERKQAGQTTIVKFTVAVNKKRKEQESTTWFSCAAFGVRGEKILEHFKQGDSILVSGPLSSRTYKEKLELEVEVQDWSFVGGGKPAPNASPRGGYSQATDEDESLPF